MRNRRLAAVLAGSLLAGTLTAGAGVALASADRAGTPAAAPAAAPVADRAGRAAMDAARTVDVLGSLGTVTREVSTLVTAAKRGGAAVGDARQSASALGSAAEELRAKVGSRTGPERQGVATRDRSGARDTGAKSVDDAIAKLKQDVQALLTALQAGDLAGVQTAITNIAHDAVDLVRAILGAIGVPLPSVPGVPIS